MKNVSNCPACQSSELYSYQKEIHYSGVGEELLPKLGEGFLGVAKLRPVVCADCGYVQLIAASSVIEKMKASDHWQKLDNKEPLTSQ